MCADKKRRQWIRLCFSISASLGKSLIGGAIPGSTTMGVEKRDRKEEKADSEWVTEKITSMGQPSLTEAWDP